MKKTWQHNEKEKWAIVDENGKIIEKFRSKGTAMSWISKLRFSKHEKLKIVEL